MKRTRADSIYDPKRFQTLSDYQEQIRPFRRICTTNIQNNDKHLSKSRKFYYGAILSIGVVSIISIISAAPSLVCAAINQDRGLCLDNSKGTFILMAVITLVMAIWGCCVVLILYSCCRRNALDGKESRRRRHVENAQCCEESQPDELLGMQTQEMVDTPDNISLPDKVENNYQEPRMEWTFEDLARPPLSDPLVAYPPGSARSNFIGAGRIMGTIKSHRGSPG